jgi:predicted DNA-binding protein
MTRDDDQLKIDPLRLPKSLELELPAEVLERLQKTAAATGRSLDEILLEILNRGLQEY